jgi:hypothetical protein
MMLRSRNRGDNRINAGIQISRSNNLLRKGTCPGGGVRFIPAFYQKAGFAVIIWQEY